MNDLVTTHHVPPFPYSDSEMPDLDKTSVSLIMAGQRSIADQMAEHQRVLRGELSDTRRELKEEVYRIRTETREELNKSTIAVVEKTESNKKRIEDHDDDIKDLEKSVSTIVNRMRGGYAALAFLVAVMVFFLSYGDKILSHIK